MNNYRYGLRQEQSVNISEGKVTEKQLKEIESDLINHLNEAQKEREEELNPLEAMKLKRVETKISTITDEGDNLNEEEKK